MISCVYNVVGRVKEIAHLEDYANTSYHNGKCKKDFQIHCGDLDWRGSIFEWLRYAYQ